MGEDIDPEDRVTYAKAVTITGRSRRYLRLRAQHRLLRRMGGTYSDVHTTWLSRVECEELALQLYRRGHAGDYWLTMTEAAAALGIAAERAPGPRNWSAARAAHRYGRLAGSLLGRSGAEAGASRLTPRSLGPA